MTSHFLAFDFGMKRIGVAVGQSITKTASPLGYLSAIDGVPVWDKIEKLIHDWKPELILVGIPLNMDGTEQVITFRARKFAGKLFAKFNIPIVHLDERLTTVEARAALFNAGGFKSLRQGEIDSMAAKVMLEDWLQQQRF